MGRQHKTIWRQTSQISFQAAKLSTQDLQFQELRNSINEMRQTIVMNKAASNAQHWESRRSTRNQLSDQKESHTNEISNLQKEYMSLQAKITELKATHEQQTALAVTKSKEVDDEYKNTIGTLLRRLQAAEDDLRNVELYSLSKVNFFLSFCGQYC